jgi:hypothetical protein
MFNTFGLCVFEGGGRLLMKSLCLVFLALLGAGQIAGQETCAYYPLRVGNRWDYIIHSWVPPPYCCGYTDSLSTRVIGDSLLPNGKRYFVLNKSVATGEGLIRADSSGIYYYRHRDSVDVLFYNLRASPGESWSAELCATSTVKLNRVDTIAQFTYLTRILEFDLDGIVAWRSTLSDKFGPIQYYSPGEPQGTEYTTFSLVGCVLSGVQFGRLTAVPLMPQLPEEFRLFQNFPNPFNPTTTIRYVVPEKGWVRIWVYDVLGRRAKQLLDGETYPGTYETTWDGRDEQGHLLASGAYFCHLLVHPSNKPTPVVLTRKMLWVR